MPILSRKDLEAAVGAGEIGAITLDTSVVKRQQYQLEAGFLRRLVNFVDSPIAFLMLDVVRDEMKQHLIDEATEARTKVRRDLKSLSRAWGTPEAVLARVATELFPIEPEISANQRIGAFVEHTGSEVIEAGARVSAGELMRRYFGNLAPFANKEDKKSEFPDAVALLALENWALENATLVLAVSGDNDWRRFCEVSSSLCLLDDLAVAFQIANADVSIATASLFEALADGRVDGLPDAINKVLRENFWQLDFSADASSYYFYTEELVDVSVQDWELNLSEAGGISVVSDGTVEASFLVTVTPKIDFRVKFETKDHEGYVPLGYTTISYENPIDVTVIGTFDIKGKRPRVTYLELVSESFELDLGDINPNFDPE